jgi:hypothetical protein
MDKLKALLIDNRILDIQFNHGADHITEVTLILRDNERQQQRETHVVITPALCVETDTELRFTKITPIQHAERL